MKRKNLFLLNFLLKKKCFYSIIIGGGMKKKGELDLNGTGD